jgi:ATP-binding protein involved in chromosome partitioning
MPVGEAIVPLEIGRANRHDVRIRWADGHESIYPAVDLRLACPCVACAQLPHRQGSGRIRMLPPGIQGVYPLRIELTGQYGIRVYWSDGHSEGIYTFNKLRAACPCCTSRANDTEGRSGASRSKPL